MYSFQKLKREVTSNPALNREYRKERQLQQIYNVLRKRKKELKLSQKEIAEKTGLARQTISKLENESVNVSLDTFIKYCDAIDIDAGQAFCDYIKRRGD